MITQTLIPRRLFFVFVANADWREYTALAPLGPATVANDKVVLPFDKLAPRLLDAAANGATGRGGYLVTGDIDAAIFSDNCRFVDPTNDVSSLARYSRALTLLFDAPTKIELKDYEIDEKARRVKAEFRVSDGVLKLPWRPRIRDYDAFITWTVGPDGLVHEQRLTWSISAAEALRETFTPGFL